MLWPINLRSAFLSLVWIKNRTCYIVIRSEKLSHRVIVIDRSKDRNRLILTFSISFVQWTTKTIKCCIMRKIQLKDSTKIKLSISLRWKIKYNRLGNDDRPVEQSLSGAVLINHPIDISLFISWFQFFKIVKSIILHLYNDIWLMTKLKLL